MCEACFVNVMDIVIVIVIAIIIVIDIIQITGLGFNCVRLVFALDTIFMDPVVKVILSPFLIP